MSVLEITREKYDSVHSTLNNDLAKAHEGYRKINNGFLNAPESELKGEK